MHYTWQRIGGRLDDSTNNEIRVADNILAGRRKIFRDENGGKPTLPLLLSASLANLCMPSNIQFKTSLHIAS